VRSPSTLLAMTEMRCRQPKASSVVADLRSMPFKPMRQIEHAGRQIKSREQRVSAILFASFIPLKM